jgi:hypothetical protein
VISVRVLVRVLAVAALAVIGVIAMGLSTAGSGSHTAPATADTVQHPSAPAKPVAWSLPRMPAGAALIGRVKVPIRTSAGWVRPVTPLGSDTWLLILRHHGRHGVALIPTSGTPKTARIDLAELDLRWIEFITCMRNAGLSIEVLTEYVRLWSQGDVTAEARKKLLQEQRELLASRLANMQKTLSILDSKIANYDRVLLEYEKRLQD